MGDHLIVLVNNSDVVCAAFDATAVCVFFAIARRSALLGCEAGKDPRERERERGEVVREGGRDGIRSKHEMGAEPLNFQQLLIMHLKSQIPKAVVSVFDFPPLPSPPSLHQSSLPPFLSLPLPPSHLKSEASFGLAGPVLHGPHIAEPDNILALFSFLLSLQNLQHLAVQCQAVAQQHAAVLVRLGENNNNHTVTR